jgi:N-acetylglucosaminyl-diphospho-decaprenol L-rhamnosyltransferase
MNDTAHLPTLHVVIVNWNGGTLLAECLRSFQSVSRDAVTVSRITVVDNASTDDSLSDLQEFSDQLPLRIIRNDRNKGFAAACNQGARSSTTDFLLFLNPDTRLLPGALEVPAKFLTNDSNTNVGIVGVQLIDAQGKVARSCARQPTVRSMIGQSLGLDRCGPSIFPTHFMSEWDHGNTRSVDQVMGAFFFLRASLFEKLGGFDERFFVYFEDLDLAVRARKMGWISVYLAAAHVFHRGSGTTDQVKGVRLFYSWRSRILYAFKHFGAVGGTGVAIVTLAVEPMIRLLALLAEGRRKEMRDVLRAACLLWSDLPQMLRGDTRSSAA